MLILSPAWREGAWRRLAEPLDLLVVGGGITGAGVFHDAVLRGLRVGLVERGDFASGTSSRSSKLVHGGLRYLRRLQLGITRTATRERDLLLEYNPHLAWRLRFLYPSYTDDATPGWQVSLGLTMYDHLSPVRHRHERLEAGAARRLAPLLSGEGLEFGLLYDDAATDDARLVLAVISAGVLGGGTALNHAPVEELVAGTGGPVTGAVVRDLPSGEVRHIAARVVVNATGVWCDGVLGMLGGVERRLRPSRGSHILVPRRRLPLEVAVTGLSPDDGRPVFAVPHPEGTLLGTTDLFHEGPLDDPRPGAGEVAYLLRFAARAFPSAEISAADVTGAFAGVRPVVDNEADDPSSASREEAIWVDRGMVSAAGGKLTTYRATAAEVVDAAVALLPGELRDGIRPAGLRSAVLPWMADPAAGAAALRERGAGAGVAAGMARRLGALAQVAADGASVRALEPVAEGCDLCPAEVTWHLLHGGVVHLDDLLLRRTRLGMWEPRRCLEVAPGLRPVVRRALGWRPARWGRELERLEAAVENWLPVEGA